MESHASRSGHLGMMTKESLAAALHGQPYERGSDMLRRFNTRDSKAAGLVVVYGASDDLMEFEGAIEDEADVYDDGTVYVDAEGLLDRDACDSDDEIAAYVERKKSARSIRAVWGAGDVSWTYETDIPHATFDVLEDGEVYCRGIVFSLADLA